MSSSRPLSWRRLRRLARGRWNRTHMAAVAGVGVLISTVAGRHHLTTPATVAAEQRPVESSAGGRRPDATDSTSAARLTAPSRVIEGSLVSEAVGRTLPYLAYLPPGYDADPSRRYPVLYLLHGLGASYTQWQQCGVFDATDRLIAAGEAEPFIIVLPQGERAYWVDHTGGGPRWGAYVARDLVAEIDARFRTLPARERRAIGGISMGGHGALQVAINNPSVFGVVGAHSFALRRHDAAPPFFGDRAWFDAHDPVALYRARAEVARTFTLWLDMGNEDGWRSAGEAFHHQLDEAGVPHTWRGHAGGHTDEYWSANMAEYVRFYAGALQGHAIAAAPAGRYE